MAETTTPMVILVHWFVFNLAMFWFVFFLYFPRGASHLWTTSTHDNIDNSAGQSQGSMSSTSATNQALVPHGSSCKTSDPNEFVNHDLILWNQTRQNWVGNRRPENRIQQLREPKLSWNASYESLLPFQYMDKSLPLL